MGVTNICRRGISQLNGGGYSPRSGRRCHIQSLESAYYINQNCQEEAKQQPNDASFRLNPRNQGF